MRSPLDLQGGSVARQGLSVLQLSTMDIGGGAEKAAWDLHTAYRRRGVHAWMAVGRKRSQDPYVFVVPNEDVKPYPTRALLKADGWFHKLNAHIPAIWRAGSVCRWLAEPRRRWEAASGKEDFDYPGTWALLDSCPDHADIIHCHNLHGGYFDLRALPWLSRQAPVILALHDAWLLSGHCAHSFDCDRWKTGCGRCPDLTIYPSIRRDASAFNWQRKRGIYAKSRLHVVTPCRWLMQKVDQSVLAGGIAESRIIPYGVDLTVFHPSSRQRVRTALGIPREARVLLFTANGIRRNIWKDYQTMRAAVAEVAKGLPGQPLLFLALGEDAPPERVGEAEVRFIPFQKDPEAVAGYYQASNVYVHAARADTFPLTVLEALACGTPVVATAVGGIPEQVKGLKTCDPGLQNPDRNSYEIDEATGMLVASGDAEGMANAVTRLLTDDGLRQTLGENAARDARNRFDLERSVDDYLSWYEELNEQRKCEGTTGHAG
jgi:glycosyltransferase involved in cell wall biosynthesis